MFTTIVMVLVIIWALRNIGKDLGLTELARKKIKKNLDDE